MNDSVSDGANASPDLKRTRRAKTDGGHRDEGIRRTLPHSLECEMGVLGCILLSPNDCLAETISKLKQGSETFYDLRNVAIYEQMVQMYEGREAIDIITLQQRLKDKQLLEQVGGIAYLSSLPDTVPSAANLSYYIDFVKEKYLLRRTIHTCTDVVGRIYDYEGEVDELMDAVERDILNIRQNTSPASKTAKQFVDEAMTSIESMFHLQGRTGGLQTGFFELDKLTDGLHAGDMVVISGYEKAGKTSLAMNIAEHVVLTLKKPVGVFDLEMTGESLMKRAICTLARVNLRDIRDGFMSEHDLPHITTAAAKLSGAPLYINDASDLTILQLRAEARRMVQLYGINLFVIDYLQLLSAPHIRKKGNREEEISHISKGIKAMAKDLGVPVIVLCQQNKSGELRESQAIIQDADGWWQLRHVGDGKKESERDDEDDARHDEEAVPVTLRVKRQRNGPTGKVYLTFIKSFTRFEPESPISEQDLPM